jgi:DNA-binding response OmpR family regulator
MRILIAEDDEALARFVRQGLEGEHYSVHVLPKQLELRRRRSTTMSSFTA